MPGSGREVILASLTSPPLSAWKTQLCRRSELLRNFRAAGSTQRKHLLCSSFIKVLHLGAWFAESWCSPSTSRDLRSKSVIFGCKWNMSYMGFFFFLTSQNHKTCWHNWLFLFIRAKDVVWKEMMNMISEGCCQRYVRSPGLEDQGRLQGWSKRCCQSLVHIVYLQSVGCFYSGVFTCFLNGLNCVHLLQLIALRSLFLLTSPQQMDLPFSGF